ncbi:terminase gpA endonuclease subunit [Paracoccus beibuensis]|uniref:terminase gpA endonuclease subunit n=1 Tax=Paracoccus beibuensis TaxID=547602 RepID=UPI002240D60E|nr:terminase gpA endonuclease subunit [Paracoccus beibuensis]
MLDTSNLTLDPYAFSRDALTEALMSRRGAAFVPSPKLDLCEWSEQHGVLAQTAAKAGQRFKPTGYQRGILQAMSDPKTRRLSLLKSAQVGATQMVLFGLGYYLEHDPSSVLFYLPTKEDVQDFYKDDFTEMARDVPAIRKILSPAGDNWHTRRTLKGSVVRFRSAFDAKNFRRIRARAVFLDEIDDDAYNPTGNTKEDKITAASERGKSYHNAILVITGTPGIKGESRCEAEFLKGDQRRYFVPCPHCTEANGSELDGFQHLEWGGPDVAYGIKWKKNQPETAHYVCKHCGKKIEEKHKGWMDRNGEWRATATPSEPGYVSFHISALYSPMPGAAWEKCVRFFLNANAVRHEKPGELKNFANLWMGETWEDRTGVGRRKDPHDLEISKTISYQGFRVPDYVRFLTAGVDVQRGKDGENGYIECSIWGWGAGERGALIGHWVLDTHDPSSPMAWEHLTELLSRRFSAENGREYQVKAAAIDSGDDTYRQEVYDFAARNSMRNWFAIKGASTPKDQIWPKAPSRGKGGMVYSIDVSAAKHVLYRRLHDEPGYPGELQFPIEWPEDGYPIDTTFFERIASEHPHNANGRIMWKKDGARKGRFGNEPWDCFVYAYASTHALRQMANGKIYTVMMSQPKTRTAPPKRPDAAPAAVEAPAPEVAAPDATKPKKALRHKRRPRSIIASF